jgi:hypothetical protein
MRLAWCEQVALPRPISLALDFNPMQASNAMSLDFNQMKFFVSKLFQSHFSLKKNVYLQFKQKK